MPFNGEEMAPERGLVVGWLLLASVVGHFINVQMAFFPSGVQVQVLHPLEKLCPGVHEKLSGKMSSELKLAVLKKYHFQINTKTVKRVKHSNRWFIFITLDTDIKHTFVTIPRRSYSCYWRNTATCLCKKWALKII